MTCFSCIKPNTSTEDSLPSREVNFPVEHYHESPKTDSLAYKTPKMQSMIEVFRCDLDRSTLLLRNDTRVSKNWSPIQYAAFRGREAALGRFLESGHSVNDGLANGESPLCIATAAGHIGTMRILCEAGADVKATTKPSGETTVHTAIKNGRHDMVELLLAYGPNLETKTITGETPLHYAAKTGNLAMTTALLKRDADYEALDNSFRSPAEIALGINNIQCALAIVNAARGTRKLKKEKDLLLHHIESNTNGSSVNKESIMDLYRAGCDPKSTVLVEAIKRDNHKLAELFLEQGADPDQVTTSGARPLFTALRSTKPHLVRSLVKHNVNLRVKNANGLSPLQVVLKSPRYHDKDVAKDLIEILLRGGAEANMKYSDGKTLLHHAVAQEFQLSSTIPLLLDAGVGVNGCDNTGCTALHAATSSRACVDRLLQSGADAKKITNDGLTPLCYALTYNSTMGSETDLESLIKASDLSSRDKNGKTPLHIASQNGHEQTVRMLLKHRVDTAAVDADCLTPLLLAVKGQNWNIVTLLASQPAVNSWDKAGATALHYVAMSTPTPPSTWKDIAIAARQFCERGVSRTMRDRSGATPLIQAVKTLNDDGLPVIEALLGEKVGDRANCVSHEDHKGRSALYFAATLGKVPFVGALLKHGATFNFEDWAKSDLVRPTNTKNKQILKLLAESEWTRVLRSLRRLSPSMSSPPLAEILPIDKLERLLAMGLDPNKRSGANNIGEPLLWTILHQLRAPTPPSADYITETLLVLLESGADPNVPRSQSRTSLNAIPLAFLVENFLKVELGLVKHFISKGANINTKSSLLENRTPLHSAVRSKRFDIVECLVKAGAEVDALDGKGLTALQLVPEECESRDKALKILANGKRGQKNESLPNPLDSDTACRGITSRKSDDVRALVAKAQQNVLAEVKNTSQMPTEKEKKLNHHPQGDPRRKQRESESRKVDKKPLNSPRIHIEKELLTPPVQPSARNRIPFNTNQKLKPKELEPFALSSRNRSQPSLPSQQASPTTKRPYLPYTKQSAKHSTPTLTPASVSTPSLATPPPPPSNDKPLPNPNTKQPTSTTAALPSPKSPIITATTSFSRPPASIPPPPNSSLPAPNLQKPLPAPRIDSGIISSEAPRGRREKWEKEKEKEEALEFSDWLAISGRLDRL